MFTRLRAFALVLAAAGALVLSQPTMASAAPRGGGGGRGGWSGGGGRGGWSGGGYRGGYYGGYRGGYYGGYGRGYGGYGWGLAGFGLGYALGSDWGWGGYPYYDSYYSSGYSPYYSYPSYDYSYMPYTTGNQGYISGYFGNTSDQGSAPDMENRCLVRVLVPDPAAAVFIGGQRMTTQGAQRIFMTPALESGKTFSYDVKATWNQDGKEVTQTRSVDVTANGRVTVDFTQPAATDTNTNLNNNQNINPLNNKPNDTEIRNKLQSLFK